MHVCTVCGRDSTEHDHRCDHDRCYPNRISHVPPLCCPGCGCGSYERSHLELVWRRAHGRGIGNVLNDRWVIEGQPGGWWVYDRVLRLSQPLRFFRLFREARTEAVELAVEDARQANLA